jgi:hypothetical protein
MTAQVLLATVQTEEEDDGRVGARERLGVFRF